MTYGFIGLGNMGGAILRGMLTSRRYPATSVFGYDTDPEKLASFSNGFGITACDSFNDVVEHADTILFAVKPQQLPDVLTSISRMERLDDKLFLSIAAGFPIQKILSLLGLPDASVVRAMPNLNAQVGEAITAVCSDSPASSDQITIAKEVFSSVGEVVLLPEKLLAAFSAVAGASPAFTFMYADALAMAGVQAGIPRDLSYKIALQSIKGSSINASLSKDHPDTLRDRVCSPGGTTIEGVTVLEENGFKGSVMDAIRAVIEKDEKLASN
ncbi:MAG: pyrroline-5-carboxylate reductase [Oscillospiraceae bacterium]|nr:pyrroline-5-carboxylate reductase [Oscillospiraceae bacterium]